MTVAQELNAGTWFIPFSEAPTYADARRLAPGAAVIARAFGGYVAFTSMELYHEWMKNR
jgi:hypothetical protein